MMIKIHDSHDCNFYLKLQYNIKNKKFFSMTPWRVYQREDYQHQKLPLLFLLQQFFVVKYIHIHIKICLDVYSYNYILQCVRESFTKEKMRKSVVIYQMGGGHPEPNSIFEREKKVFFQGPHRTILGHPKHVLHLVLSLMRCIGLSDPLISDFGLFWPNVN